MAEEHRIERVLICARSTLVPRLMAHYAEQGVEAVVGFSEADVDAPWIEEADFAAYLNGRSARESYLHPERVVSAAMDAGCDAIHPGASSLAESVELYHLANNANVAVITADPTVVARAADRSFQRGIAHSRGARLLPASEPLGPDQDGIEAAAPLGVPIDVVTSHGVPLARVRDLARLPEVMAQAREVARSMAGAPELVLRPPVPASARPRTTLVAAERVGRVVPLGTTTATLWSPEGHVWVEELGPDGSADDTALGRRAEEIVRGLRWVGVAAVRWVAWDDDVYFVQVSTRLPTGFELFEQVHGLEILTPQLSLLQGKPLGWGPSDGQPTRWGMQARLVHRVAGDDTATLEAFALPEGASPGAGEGQSISADTHPVLALITVVADHRDAARAALAAAVAEVRVDGVPTNLQALRDHLDR